MSKLSTITDPEFLANRQARDHGRHGPSLDPLLRPAVGFFLGLHADYDLMARRRELGGDLELIEPRAA